MFDILSIELTNFRSYCGTHKFQFPKNPGLYSLTGINLCNPRLGANDCGKTTLLEGIHWGLFGRTSRGLRAGDIINWGSTSCCVSVLLLVSDKQLLITRQQSPNKLVCNGKNVTQEELESELRLTPEQFSFAVMLPQFGNSFFDLGPTEKLNLFSQIMSLDYWLDKAKQASELATELNNAIQGLKYTLTATEAKLGVAEKDVSELTAKSANFKQEKRNKITVAKDRVRKELRELDRLKLVLEQDQTALENIDKKLRGFRQICPSCNQPIKADYEKTLEKNKEDFTRNWSRTEREISNLLASIERDEQRVEEEKQRENPYHELAETKASEVSSLKREIDSTTAEIAALQKDHATVDFWVSGFKRIRLYVVDTTLRQLEVEVNNNLTSLGLADWQVKFDIERETKAGGVTKGFTVLIHAPNRADPIRWEAFGGGVTQRLRLAGNLGLANLIMERAGLRNQIEFYDEPSSYMTDAGIEDMLETLHARAIETGRKIWIIDHHSLEFGGYAGVLKIVKTKEGIQLVN